MESMIPAEKKCFDLICDFYKNQGRPPAVWEISPAMGLAMRNGAQRYFTSLEEKGYLERRDHKYFPAGSPGREGEVTVESNSFKVFELMRRELYRAGA